MLPRLPLRLWSSLWLQISLLYWYIPTRKYIAKFLTASALLETGWQLVFTRRYVALHFREILCFCRNCELLCFSRHLWNRHDDGGRPACDFLWSIFRHSKLASTRRHQCCWCVSRSLLVGEEWLPKRTHIHSAHQRHCSKSTATHGLPVCRTYILRLIVGLRNKALLDVFCCLIVGWRLWTFNKFVLLKLSFRKHTQLMMWCSVYVVCCKWLLSFIHPSSLQPAVLVVSRCDPKLAQQFVFYLRISSRRK